MPKGEARLKRWWKSNYRTRCSLNRNSTYCLQRNLVSCQSLSLTNGSQPIKNRCGKRTVALSITKVAPGRGQEIERLGNVKDGSGRAGNRDFDSRRHSAVELLQLSARCGSMSWRDAMSASCAVSKRPGKTASSCDGSASRRSVASIAWRCDSKTFQSSTSRQERIGIIRREGLRVACPCN